MKKKVVAAVLSLTMCMSMVVQTGASALSDGVSDGVVGDTVVTEPFEPEEEFHVVRFQQMAKEAMKEIYAAGHIPIIAGGTGFYIQALLYDINFEESEQDDVLREELEQYAQEHGAEALHDRLALVDPKSAEEIHAHNVKRVIRAIEFYEQTGMPISEHNEKERQKVSPYEFRYFVLNDERSHLYERINARVDEMLAQGLIEEVRALKARGCTKDMVSMQGLGYKEILEYLEGTCTLEEAVYRLKRDTRHFAKRQITWFKRERDVIWIDKKEHNYDEKIILDTMLTQLKGIR